MDINELKRIYTLITSNDKEMVDLGTVIGLELIKNEPRSAVLKEWIEGRYAGTGFVKQEIERLLRHSYLEQLGNLREEWINIHEMIKNL